MNDYVKNLFENFVSMIRKFLSREMNAMEFEREYMKLWKDNRDGDELYDLNQNHHRAFDRIFSAVDCYCGDPQLRDENDLDDEGLLKEVGKIYSKSLLSR